MKDAEQRGFKAGVAAVRKATVEAMALKRASALSPQDFFLLDQWGRQLRDVFGDYPYLVGSAERGDVNYRDVDMRMLLPKGAGWIAKTPGRLAAINLAITLWGRSVTNLPIDFQFQPADEFHKYDGQTRNPMGPRSRSTWKGE